MLLEKYEIKVSRDKMTATIVQKGQSEESETFTYEQLAQFVKEQGIEHGVKEDVLKEIVKNQGALLDKPVVIAEGTPPVHGKNAELQPVDFTKKQEEKKEDNKKINFRDVMVIPNVTKGELIGEKIPATPGTDGINVLGQAIPAKPGRDFVLRKGKNTVISADGLQIFADIDGQVSVDKKTIHVYPVYEVKGDLDMKTGNIDFVGNVIIKGNVPNGFEIKAKGDIHVFGTVESAFLNAEGSIFVNAGIVGQGSGKVYAQNDLHTTFINQANIEVEGDLHVSQSILHSNILAGGSIYCNEGKGNIVGGNISAGKYIFVNECGNMMHTLTNIFIGENQKIIERKKWLENEISKLNEEMTKLNKLKSLFEMKEKSGNALPPKEKIMKLRVLNTLQDMECRIQEYSEELEDLNKDSNKEVGFLQVKNHLYENTTISFGKYSRKITNHFQYVKVVFENSEIKIVNL